MNTKQIIRQYRAAKRKLDNLQSAFAAYVRAHMEDETARKAYADRANVVYFRLVGEMKALKAQYTEGGRREQGN
jgi:hypothetical protein